MIDIFLVIIIYRFAALRQLSVRVVPCTRTYAKSTTVDPVQKVFVQKLKDIAKKQSSKEVQDLCYVRNRTAV